MYLTISAQKMGSTYNSSVGNYVDYLEKENEDRLPEQREEFFDQENDSVSPEKVVEEIDVNTFKMRQKDPEFYSIVVSPNQRKLKAIGNDPNLLREYTRKLMEDYAKSFHRNQEVKAPVYRQIKCKWRPRSSKPLEEVSIRQEGKRHR